MTDPNFRISTPRLYLSHFQPALDAHCDFLVALYNTPAFIASIGGKPTAITTRAAARKTLSTRFVAEHARNGYGTYLVSLKPGATEQPNDDDDGDNEGSQAFPATLEKCTPIGTVSLMRGDAPTAYKAPDLGFAILPPFARRGYATEAARALLDYAERALGVADVLGLFDPANEGSRGVFRKLGFRDRGTRVLAEFGGVEGAVWLWRSEGLDRGGDLGVYGL